MVEKRGTVADLSEQHEFAVAGWEVNPTTLRMTRGEATVKLEPRVMQVLVYLAQKPGEVVPREELEANVWKGRVVGYDAVANTIIKLRKAFGDDSRQPHVIETISKTGYRLIAEVVPLTRESREPASIYGSSPSSRSRAAKRSARCCSSSARCFSCSARGGRPDPP